MFSPFGFMGTQVASSTYLLDTYGGAEVAYSLRKLSSSSTYAVTVRRDNDNATQDIGFVGEAFDTASLTSFVGANTGYITKWYDQSGNVNDATQSDTTLQPFIVSSGSIEVQDGIVAINFATIDNAGLTLPSLSSLTEGEVFNLVKSAADPPSQGNAGWIKFGTAGNVNHYPWLDGNIYDDFGSNDRKNLGNPATPLNQWNIYGITTKTNDWTARLNSTQIYSTGTNTVSFSATPTFTSAATYILQKWITEFVLYPSDQASNRSGIESNINTYYSIY
jgi:hypothetical protein